MSILQEDWADKFGDGLGEDWTILPGSFTQCQIMAYGEFGVAGFRNNVQRVSRQANKNGDIGIYCNDFGILSTNKNYQVEFWYRAAILPLVLSKRVGGLYYNIDTYSVSSTNAVHVITTVYGDGSGFNSLIFSMAAGREPMNTPLWFEIDRVSCREII